MADIVKKIITKSAWLTATQCLTRAWHALRASPSTPDEAELFRMEQGQQVGALARRLFPNGILVSKIDGKTTAERTQELMVDNATEALFEPTFHAGPFVAKADILIREGNGWHVFEVKSSFSDTDLIPLVFDLAYTAMVLRQAKVAVKRASLVLLSRNYRFGDDPVQLFDTIDQTEEVLKRAAKFESGVDFLSKTLFSDQSPPPSLLSACRDCTFFSDKCLGAGIDHTVLELPSLHQKKLKRLAAEGIVDLSKIPGDLQLNERQERAKQSALSGEIVVEDGLHEALEAIVWPCHYLDFETVASVLPLYTGHGCHQQVLTQFSIHHRDSIDAEPRHSEYLADATRDCQRELAESLIADLREPGSIIVYSSFEMTRIKALLKAFPDLAEPLQAILARLIDLLPIVADYIYHPEFHGSFSIKDVLPALVPDLSYAGLDIADGDTAITRFARMARGEISGNDIEATRRSLLEYCKLDTFAMVRLHEALLKLRVGPRREVPEQLVLL